MLKVVLIGMTAVFLSMVAGSVKKEYGFMVAVCAAFMIFSYGLSKISVIVTEVQNLKMLLD